MISREELEELIEKKGTIYYIENNLFNKDIKTIVKLEFCGIGRTYRCIEDGFISGKYDLCEIVGYDEPEEDFIAHIENVYKTYEEAEFTLKYKETSIIEKLSLPTFEEIGDEFYRKRFFVEDKEYQSGVVEYMLVVPKCEDKHGIMVEFREIPLIFGEHDDAYDIIFEEDRTEENYLKACEICRKLFLGEAEDQNERI